MEKRHILSFSGGADSTALLLKMIENNMPIDDIIFCDTGLEFPELLRHINKVENAINRKITRLKSEKSFEYYMLEHIKTKGKDVGGKGLRWPSMQIRWCTRALKVSLIEKYIKEKYNNSQIIQYIGYTIDEQKRAKEKKSFIYPLIDFKMTGIDALKYCYSKGFDWEGLYKKFSRTGCYLCPMQDLKSLYNLNRYYPEFWENLKRLDKLSIEKYNKKFRADYSVEELELKFRVKELPLFKINV